MQEPRKNSGNLALFMFLTFGVLLLHNMWFGQKAPPPDKDKPVAQAKADPDKKKQAEEPKKDDADAPKTVEPLDPTVPDGTSTVVEPTDEPKPAAEEEMPPIDAGPMPKFAGTEGWYTLGSADPKDPYRMLVTVTDRGAAVASIALNSPRYRALMEDDGWLSRRGGYLGNVVMREEKSGNGCLVQVVGRGTPAEKAGLKPGDVIKAVGQTKVASAKKLGESLRRTKPGRKVDLTVSRDGKEETLPVTLGIPPLEVVRPEAKDPLSFQMTLSRIDDLTLPDMEVDKEQPKDKVPAYVEQELDGLNLRGGTWEVVEHSQDRIEFRCKLPRWGLEVSKVYRLDRVPEKEQENTDYPAYNLVMEVSVRNVGSRTREVAYQLDGPTGLPLEGWWFANKVGYCWSAGLRDVVVRRDKQTPVMVGCTSIAKDTLEAAWDEESITFIGVDAQYFSAILIPKKKDPAEIWFANSMPLRVGPTNEIERLTNVSCRLRSVSVELPPGGESIEHDFTVFAGPKREDILTHYGLGELVYYGWFDFVARPMAMILNFFFGIVRNYGLAILMLTVLVRGIMFPMSRKQAQGAQKMAELQPEIKKIQEKHKKDMEARTKAQQELFKKHGYNPLSGCLVMFVQLPVFIGLYRALMVNVELRGSPLLWSNFRWCSNLAAPDMLFDWHAWMPMYFTHGIGAFTLGPYFNILPIFTVVLFLMQQKMFMPPPADEQQAMQQNVMKYMMLFMGILFFKVASGLCVYFIASSLWGLAERKFLPKTPKKDTPPPPAQKLRHKK
ncbi:MAG: membrane protein insertase YidC [Pirellulaceae bacterium]|nr:membrane protein insertase YidC [Pirellulaceae bacterium]